MAVHRCPLPVLWSRPKSTATSRRANRKKKRPPTNAEPGRTNSTFCSPASVCPSVWAIFGVSPIYATGTAEVITHPSIRLVNLYGYLLSVNTLCATLSLFGAASALIFPFLPYRAPVWLVAMCRVNASITAIDPAACLEALLRPPHVTVSVCIQKTGHSLSLKERGVASKLLDIGRSVTNEAN